MVTKNTPRGPPISWVPPVVPQTSLPYVDGPTSLMRGEGHLLVLSSVVGDEFENPDGDGDSGGRDERRINQDQQLILD